MPRRSELPIEYVLLLPCVFARGGREAHPRPSMHQWQRRLRGGEGTERAGQRGLRSCEPARPWSKIVAMIAGLLHDYAACSRSGGWLTSAKRMCKEAFPRKHCHVLLQRPIPDHYSCCATMLVTKHCHPVQHVVIQQGCYLPPDAMAPPGTAAACHRCRCASGQCQCLLPSQTGCLGRLHPERLSRMDSDAERPSPVPGIRKERRQALVVRWPA